MDDRWESFAKDNPYWYILAPFDGSTEEFWDSGKREAEKIIQLVKGELCRFDRVIEIGCGVGRVLIPMCLYFKEAIGVDISPTMLGLLENYVEMNGVKGKIKAMLPTEEWYLQKSDFIFSVKTLYYIDDLATIDDYMNKVSESLVGDGLAYLQFDTRHVTIPYRLRHKMPDFLLPKKWQRGIRRIRRKREDLVEIFGRHGFRVIKEQNVNSPYHVFVLMRA